MVRGRLAVHGHFYQPLRSDPFSGRVPPDPSAAPFRDWNTRIDAEGSGGAVAMPYHHLILPLAPRRDKVTEVRWGIADFRHRFGRPPDGLWLPETAVDLATLRVLAEEGIRFTVLAPWQAAETSLETRRPYRVELGGGQTIVVAFYDAGLSGSVSFEPSATSDADRFARERVATRLAGAHFADGEPGLVVIATDGELYGHHQQFRDLFLQRLVSPGPSVADRGFDVVELASAILEPAGRTHPAVRIADRTSWSCHHGVARWTHECPDAHDGRWKGPLRAAFERLAGAIDAETARVCRELDSALDPWAARDEYVSVVIGAEAGPAFAGRWLSSSDDAARGRLLTILDAQRWRLAMFASDGWYWDDPIRPETRQVMRCAARAARLVDGLTDAQARLERQLIADLALLTSPGRGLDGAAIYGQALEEVDQPGPPDP
jgi:hypothetical protein